MGRGKRSSYCQANRTDANGGSDYSDDEINRVFQDTIRGVPFYRQADYLHRSEGAIHSLWKRICKNRGAYRGEKVYGPLLQTRQGDKPIRFLNFRLKEFLRYQCRFYLQEDGNIDEVLDIAETAINAPSRLVEEYCFHIFTPEKKRSSLQDMLMGKSNSERSLRTIKLQPGQTILIQCEGE